MRAVNYFWGLLIIFSCTHSIAVVAQQDDNNNQAITIPLGGNTWRSGNEKAGGEITNNGIENWSDSKVSFTTYVRFAKTGNLKLSLHLSAPEGESVISVSALHNTKKIKLQNSTEQDQYVGEWQVKDTGYVAFTFKGISKAGRTFPSIESMQLSGTAIGERTAFVKNNEGNFFYWGRRGPSVHLNYIVPENEQVQYFYNEVTVPKGNDVIGSYFMADGFGEGYFGMQVNSQTERHILFSVWSPYKTDNPKEIPDSLQIKLIKKGQDVHAGAFGDEGSGGQSYLNYNWKAGTTYKFLVSAKPDDHNRTTYTAWFYTPESKQWLLIASFKRPNTNTYLTHLYSFLENFDPEQGNITRKVFFDNQWIRDTTGQWIALDKAKFTCDNTGNKKYRMDYKGGVNANSFFLQNCGFFNDYTEPGINLERQQKSNQPMVQLDKLP